MQPEQVHYVFVVEIESRLEESQGVVQMHGDTSRVAVCWGLYGYIGM